MPAITEYDRNRLSPAEWTGWNSRGVWNIASVRGNRATRQSSPMVLQSALSGCFLLRQNGSRPNCRYGHSNCRGQKAGQKVSLRRQQSGQRGDGPWEHGRVLNAAIRHVRHGLSCSGLFPAARVPFMGHFRPADGGTLFPRVTACLPALVPACRHGFCCGGTPQQAALWGSAAGNPATGRKEMGSPDIWHNQDNPGLKPRPCHRTCLAPISRGRALRIPPS